MAEQEEGWPLGLQPLGLQVRNHNNFSGSISFNTLISASSSTSSSDSRSDLDTESTGSFFHDRSITLGSLIGVSSIVELSRRSARGRRPDQTLALDHKKRCNNKSKTYWCFSLCPRDNKDVEIVNNNTIPLGHFLAVERRTATDQHRRSHSPLLYGPPDELSMAQPYPETNSLFINGNIAPPPPLSHRSSPCSTTGSPQRREAENGYRSASVLFPCICG